jgi:hypothetical protein
MVCHDPGICGRTKSCEGFVEFSERKPFSDYLADLRNDQCAYGASCSMSDVAVHAEMYEWLLV